MGIGGGVCMNKSVLKWKLGGVYFILCKLLLLKELEDFITP
jgi:hypothetical protein